MGNKLGPSFAWLALVPLGLAAYMLFLQLELGDPFKFLSAQSFWMREPALPFVGIYEGLKEGASGLLDLVHGSAGPQLWSRETDTFDTAWQNFELAVYLLFGLVALVGVLKRLPLAYGLYTLVALALPLSTPSGVLPLMSLPRFVAVTFPIFMWLALVTVKRRLLWPVVTVFALLLAYYTAQFATWHWVS